MTLGEIGACSYLEASNTDDEDNLTTEHGDHDFASDILERRAAVSNYRYCSFQIPTSNVLERFFSLGVFTSSSLRQGLNASNLEEQLLLKINHCFWDDVETVNQLMN